MKTSLRNTILLALVTGLSGCASTNPRDPFESFNRAMFTFNDTIDQAAVKPAAEVYSTLPEFIQIGVNNFFSNLGDVWTAVNSLLQGKFENGVQDMARFTFNSTLGLGGLIDIASEAGMPKHSEDFGQTLGKWGVGSGPYVVLPLLGSTTVRDAFAKPVDVHGDPLRYVEPVHWRNSGSVLRVLDFRSSVLDASNLLEDAALDRYSFVRDAFLQRRQSHVYDGEPPSAAYEFDVGPTKAAGSVTAPVAEPQQKPLVTLEQTSAGAAMSAADVKK